MNRFPGEFWREGERLRSKRGVSWPICDVGTRVKVLLKLFKEDVKPHAWVNVRLGMEAIFRRYDHKSVEPEGEFPDLAREYCRANQSDALQETVRDWERRERRWLFSTWNGDGLRIRRDEFQRRLCVENSGDTQAHYDDCFAMFNPVTREKHDEVVEAWAGAGLSLAHLMRAHPAVEEKRSEKWFVKGGG